ncbi:uncharacterized protein [Choristoneura fumiferana]|uniref:uncharacterized protein n=1 Tax=Choristoneura fumiferana TaxID=7141 RepID=UPI003D15D781
MKAIVVWIFIIAIPSLSIQQYYNQAHSVAHYHLPYSYEKQYVSGDYHRSSHRHRHPHKHGNSGSHLAISYESADTDTDSYQDTCECECQRCADPKPCCTRVCVAECQEQMPANLVFVPYPYPLVMPDVHPSIPAADTTTTTTTTTTQTTPTTTKTTTTTTVETSTETSEEPVDIMRLKASCDQKLSSKRIRNNFYDELRSNMKSRQDFQKDFREQLGIRPVKPNVIPKYGIVPIPDKILQSLFSQVRNNKRP